MANGKPYLKTVHTDVLAVVDGDGVVQEKFRQERKVKVKGDRSYAQWFHNLSPVIKSLKHVSDIKLLYWIGKNLEYNEGIISLNKVFKTRCAKEMDISTSATDKSIKELKKIDVLVAHENSRKSAIFRVNPMYLWRGTEAKRDKKEREWLERAGLNDLPDKEKKQQKNVKKSPPKRGPFDFRGVKSA